jgi:hybrid cluster-associated redox disulfide protein
MPEQTPTIEPDMLVDQVMREWPATIRVFLDFRMKCVGCPIAAFQTINDACREHEVDRAKFLQALRLAARESFLEKELERQAMLHGPPRL